MLAPLMLAAGCASSPERPAVPAEVVPSSVAARILAPPEQVEISAQAAVLPDTPGQTSAASSKVVQHPLQTELGFSVSYLLRPAIGRVRRRC